MLPDSLRVVVAGQTGVCKSGACQRLLDAAIQDDSMRLREDDFGFAEVDDQIWPFQPFLVSKVPTRQRARWYDAWQHTCELVDGRRFELIGIHLTYCCEARFFSACRYSAIVDYNPDFIVALVDDCYSVSHRVTMRACEDGVSYHFRLREILSWRYAEIAAASQLQSLINHRRHAEAQDRGDSTWRPCRLFIFAVRHDPRVLVKLLLRFAELPRTYMCFPIGDTRGDPDAQQEIDASRQAVSDAVIAFDPLAMDEKILLPALRSAEEEGRETVRLDLGSRWQGGPILVQEGEPGILEFDISEVREVRDVIEDMIEERDFRLIDQSSSICAYRPWWNGRRGISSGMNAELKYARDTAEVAVFIFDPKRDYVPDRSTFGPRPGQVHIQTENDGFPTLVDGLAGYDEGRGPEEIPLARTEGLL